MARFSTISLWALAGVSMTVSACADVLGFQSFTDSNPSGGGDSSGGASFEGTSRASQNESSGSGGTGTGAGTGTGTGTGTGNATGGETSASSSTAGGVSSTSHTSSMTSNAGPGTSSAKMSSAASSSAASSSSMMMSMNPPGPCTFGTAHNGNGSFTYYYFGQGTTQQGEYKTACGYNGTETGSGMGAVDTVPNAANGSPAKDTYFAAIPNSSGTTFDTVTDCGACVEITNGGNKIVATIIDECPVASNPACTNGHLDLSTQAFDALNFPNGDPSGTTWKFVPCPEGTKNIQAVENSAGQFYLQSSVYPISTVNGQGPTQNGYFNVNPGSVTVVSSAANQTITINIPSGGGDTGANFTSGTNCY